MISTNLKNLRKKYKYTQEGIADKIGVSRQPGALPVLKRSRSSRYSSAPVVPSGGEAARKLLK